MEPEIELGHLIELMPASGRMLCRVTLDDRQDEVISAKFPMPWQGVRPISINFDLWEKLSRPQRDLLFLRTVCWLTNVRWVKPDLFQSLAAVGLLGTLVEFAQGNAMGTAIAIGVTGFSGYQIWRNSRNSVRDLEADELAIQVAQRRGYSATDAARALFEAIEAVAHLEHRPALEFSELVRVQQLKANAGLSPQRTPNLLRQD